MARVEKLHGLSKLMENEGNLQGPATYDIEASADYAAPSQYHAPARLRMEPNPNTTNE